MVEKISFWARASEWLENVRLVPKDFNGLPLLEESYRAKSIQDEVKKKPVSMVNKEKLEMAKRDIQYLKTGKISDD